MTEIEAIIHAARQARNESQTAVMATVVHTAGSSYRMPGARMLVTDQGWQAGSISGGCLEGDILRRGAWLTQDGPAVLTYDTTDDDDIAHGLGLGCRGIVRVLIERVAMGEADQSWLGFIDRHIAQRTPAVVATLIDAPGNARGQRLLFDAGGQCGSTVSEPALSDVLAAAAGRALTEKTSSSLVLDTADGAVHAFIEYFAPAPALVLFGAGYDAIPLAEMATMIGLHVTVVDARPAYAKPARFPKADAVVLCKPEQVGERVALSADTLAVVMSHHYLTDLTLLRQLFDSPARYIGLLGPKKRAQELLTDLEAQGRALSAYDRERLHAPLGLDIGAADASQVALSALAEIQAFLSGRHGGHLRHRTGSIHATGTGALPPVSSPAASAAQEPSCRLG